MGLYFLAKSMIFSKKRKESGTIRTQISVSDVYCYFQDKHYVCR